jgi:hypothetical protein
MSLFCYLSVLRFAYVCAPTEFVYSLYTNIHILACPCLCVLEQVSVLYMYIYACVCVCVCVHTLTIIVVHFCEYIVCIYIYIYIYHMRTLTWCTVADTLQLRIVSSERQKGLRSRRRAGLCMHVYMHACKQVQMLRQNVMESCGGANAST